MSNENALRVTAPQLTRPAEIAPQWKELKKRARTLKISSTELEMCGTIQDLHALAKRKYRERLRESHPDRQIKGADHLRATYAKTYNRVIAAYRWIIGVKPEMFQRVIKNRSTVHDRELPLDWGVGWAEYDRRYDGFTILPRL